MIHAQQFWAHVIFLSTCHAVLTVRHASPQCFFNVFSCVIAVSCHATYLFNPIQSFSPVVNVHLLKIVSTPTWTYSHLSPLLVVKLTNSTLLLAVNFHPSPSPVPHTHNPPPPLTGRQRDKETGRQAGRWETGRKTRQAGRQDRHGDVKMGRLLKAGGVATRIKPQPLKCRECPTVFVASPNESFKKKFLTARHMSIFCLGVNDTLTH